MKLRIPHFRDLPFQQKIIALMLGTCLAALGLAGASFLISDVTRFRASMLNHLTVLGQIVGENAKSPLGFSDRSFAGKTLLASLEEHPRVTAAVLYDSDNALFAQFLRMTRPNGTNLPALRTNGFSFSANSLQIFQPIEEGGERLGTLFLESDLEELNARFRAYWRIGFGVLAISLIGATAVAVRLQRFISRPVLELAETARKVASEKDYSLRARKLAKDELGSFTDTFNQMLAQIQQQEQEIKTVSRFAGMAEVATGVLHNVGNVLNSVNVSATLLKDRTAHSKARSLELVAELVRDNHHNLAAYLSDDPKGRLLPQYLIDLSAVLAEEHAENLKELTALTRNVEHIKEIVAMQQGYARVSGLIEAISPADLLEDAIRINSAGLNQRGVQLVRDYQQVPPIWADKHKVLQILVNLLSNAGHALETVPDGRREIALTVRSAGPAQVSISVCDNGTGIPPENLTRIFNHGFTTRQKGHGFGLHSGANSAREMGGSLRAESAGLGKGAVFTLQLPVNTKARTPQTFKPAHPILV